MLLLIFSDESGIINRTNGKVQTNPNKLFLRKEIYICTKQTTQKKDPQPSISTVVGWSLLSSQSKPEFTVSLHIC